MTKTEKMQRLGVSMDDCYEWLYMTAEESMQELDKLKIPMQSVSSGKSTQERKDGADADGLRMAVMRFRLTFPCLQMELLTD